MSVDLSNISPEIRAACKLKGAALAAAWSLDEPDWMVHKPTPRQALFLSLNDKEEVFYGGAAGGGKTDALLMAALQYVQVPGYSALILMKSYADLSKPGALIPRSQEWLRGTPARYNEQKKQWTFPTSNPKRPAILSFGFIDTENDKFNYKTAEFQFCAFDELVRFTESSYTYMFSRLRRLKGSNVPIRMRSGSNPAQPGEPGIMWVKQRFISKGFTPADAIEPKVLSKEGINERGEATCRYFVPSRLDDNPHLDREAYKRSLSQLDAVSYEQLLKGDWEIQQRGDILWMWDERYHVITWSEFAALYGVKHIPKHWKLGVFQDQGTSDGHPCITSWFATAGANGPLPDSVFLYRGLTVTDMGPREVAEAMRDAMWPLRESERMMQWRNSHEAASERIAYVRDHNMPFSSWTAGPNIGIAQLRDYLTPIDKYRPHPFGRTDLRGNKLMGRPRLYFLVDDDQLDDPRDDRGLARHRAEAPAYHYKRLKTGEENTKVEPHPLFNDAMDTIRSAAYEYFPPVEPMTRDEEAEKQYQRERAAVADQHVVVVGEAAQFAQDVAKRHRLAEIKSEQGNGNKTEWGRWFSQDDDDREDDGYV